MKCKYFVVRKKSETNVLYLNTESIKIMNSSGKVLSRKYQIKK